MPQLSRWGLGAETCVNTGSPSPREPLSHVNRSSFSRGETAMHRPPAPAQVTRHSRSMKEKGKNNSPVCPQSGAGREFSSNQLRAADPKHRQSLTLLESFPAAHHLPSPASPVFFALCFLPLPLPPSLLPSLFIFLPSFLLSSHSPFHIPHCPQSNKESFL